MAGTIASLLEALDNATDHSVESLERILADNLPSKAEVCAASESVMPYGRTLLKLTDKYEVIIGTWPKSGWCDAHDHGDATGVVRSYGGDVVHLEYRMNGDCLELFHQSEIKEGEQARLPMGMIHALHNVSSDEPYVGLHLYAPPPKDVRVFDIKNGTIFHIANDAASIIPTDPKDIISVEEKCFTFKNLVREPEMA
jgi:hypothetical protein